VCPAYESFFILDDQTATEHFSYFRDSIPRTDFVATTKNQFGIIQDPFIKRVVNKVPPPIRSPFAKLNTIEPEVIYPAKNDSTDLLSDKEMRKELDVVDSSAVAQDTVKQEKNWHFNLDQEAYFNYLVKKLKIPITPVEEQEAEDQEQGVVPPGTEGDTTRIKSGKKGGLFKNLFKKKNKETSTPEENNAPEENQDQQNQPADKKQGN